MSGDANGIATMATSLYSLYGAPFELVLGTVFLYQLLGWSAFAGFGVLVAVWPVNKLIAARGCVTSLAVSFFQSTDAHVLV